MKKATTKKSKSKAKYIMILKSVGNPDFKQYAPVSNPERVTGDTLQEMRDHAIRYCKYWDLGGGNWTSPMVMEGKKAVGHFSYNMRFWEGSSKFKTLKEMMKRKEIKIEEEAVT
jgi:hypothetical protein